jgi:hypothetical protein
VKASEVYHDLGYKAAAEHLVSLNR